MSEDRQRVVAMLERPRYRLLTALAGLEGRDRQDIIADALVVYAASSAQGRTVLSLVEDDAV